MWGNIIFYLYIFKKKHIKWGKVVDQGIKIIEVRLRRNPLTKGNTDYKSTVINSKVSLKQLHRLCFIILTCLVIVIYILFFKILYLLQLINGRNGEKKMLYDLSIKILKKMKSLVGKKISTWKMEGIKDGF